MRGPPLLLTDAWRTTCIILQVLPIPGVGAIIAGIKNPHSAFLGRGIAQVVLVVFGSWPLILPGAAGLGWAIWDAARIARLATPPGPLSIPAPGADPQTLSPTRAEKRAAAQGRRNAKAAARARARAERRARRSK